MLKQRWRFVRRTSALAAFCVALLFGVRVDATAPAVTLGEVTARGVQASKRALFTGIVRDEFARLHVPASADGSSFELSASLVHFRTENRDGTLTTSCSVSAIVRDRRGGALRAILRGRARAEDTPERASIAERSVMKVAVKSALKRVGEAVR